MILIVFDGLSGSNDETKNSHDRSARCFAWEAAIINLHGHHTKSRCAAAILQIAGEPQAPVVGDDR